MLQGLQDFHFLRPQWLLLIAAAGLLVWLVERRDNPRIQLRGVIAPHLLDHLLIDPRRRLRIRPVHLVALGIAISALGLAGPTWQREATPFTEDTAPLVVVIDLSPDMDAIDVQPTRLERVKLKVRDLLKARQGARTALVVYTGNAYRVLPLTDDPELVELFLSSLATGLMPSSGRNSGKALQLAEATLSKATTPGTILFVGSGVERSSFSQFKAASNGSKNQVLFLAVGTSKGGPMLAEPNRFRTDSAGNRTISRMDTAAFKSLTEETGVAVTGVTLDDSDLKWIEARVQSHLVAAREKDPHARWKDFGYFLTFPVALLTVLWFRKGWTVRWLPVVILTFFAPGASASEFKFVDLWMTRDQQGRYNFERGNYFVAAERFEDPFWKGIAFYRAGKSDEAISALALADTADGHFWEGNSHAHLKKYPEAVQAYEQALKMKARFPEAEANKALVLSLIPKKPKDPDPDEEAPNLQPDEIKFDDKGKKGKQGTVPKMEMSPEKMAEIWMRQIQVTPAEFLRRKFSIEEAKAGKR